MFSVLHRNSRWLPNVAGKRFCLYSPVDSSYKLRDKNFIEIPLSRTISEISVFNVPSGHPVGVENFNKIPLSHTVKQIEANLCFFILGENLKIKNGRHFQGEENLLKFGSRLLILCGSKSSTKLLYLRQLRR